MRIERYVGTTKSWVEKRGHDIWLGISLGNKYFTKDHIQKYVSWMFKYTKSDIVILVADRIHAVNIEVTSKYSKLAAQRRAMRMGDEKIAEVNRAIKNFSRSQQGAIHVMRWDDIASENYKYQHKVLRDEFTKKTELYDYVLAVVRQNFARSPKNLSLQQYERLSEYVLMEIPLLLDGIAHEGSSSACGKVHDLQPYPGIGMIDQLLWDLRHDKRFNVLKGALKMGGNAILEAYVD